MLSAQPVSSTNVVQVPTEQLAQFINIAILSNKLPVYSPNYPLDIERDIRPRLSKYSNDYAYLSELYLIILSEFYNQKKYKRNKDERRNEGLAVDLEAKERIIYRARQAVEKLYEGASRMMTGIGFPDVRLSRHD